MKLFSIRAMVRHDSSRERRIRRRRTKTWKRERESINLYLPLVKRVDCQNLFVISLDSRKWLGVKSLVSLQIIVWNISNYLSIISFSCQVCSCVCGNVESCYLIWNPFKSVRLLNERIRDSWIHLSPKFLGQYLKVSTTEESHPRAKESLVCILSGMYQTTPW